MSVFFLFLLRSSARKRLKQIILAAEASELSFTPALNLSRRSCVSVAAHGLDLKDQG
jgi:hypothetical protein